MKKNNLMKTILLAGVQMLCCGTALAQGWADYPSWTPEQRTDSMARYTEQMRQGDISSYYPLSMLYATDGTEQGFMNGFAVAQIAKQRGYIRTLEKWAEDLPAESLGNQLYRLSRALERGDFDEVHQRVRHIHEQGLMADWSPFITCLIQKDEEGIIHTLNELAQKEGLLIHLLQYTMTEDPSHMEVLAAKVPFYNNELARLRGAGEDELSADDMAAKEALYRLADAAGMLSPEGARWLTEYYRYKERKEGIKPDAVEMERLERLKKPCQHEPQQEQ